MAKRRSAPGIDPAASDEELVASCLAGDERAWSQLIGRYAAYVYAIATRAFRLPPPAADEVFQDVCVRLYEGLGGFTGKGEFRSWLRAVVLSAAREYLRREARRAELTETEDPDAGSRIDELEAALDLRAAVTALGEPCRGTIGLYFFRNLTQAEVAQALAVPPGTVAARLSRCLRRLRDALQESGGRDPSRG